MEKSPNAVPDDKRDPSRYTFTVDEASALFANAGVPRSPRSVQRYCKHSVLDCVVMETGTNEKYLIDPASVERRIIELKQVLQATGDATGRDSTRQDATGRGTSRQQPEAIKKERELGEKITQLETEIGDLRFDSRVNRELAKYVQQQNRDLITQINEQSRLIGRLETELRVSIEAPRSEITEILSADTISETDHTEVGRDVYEEGDNSVFGRPLGM